MFPVMWFAGSAWIVAVATLIVHAGNNVCGWPQDVVPLKLFALLEYFHNSHGPL